jgi:hypothetical protein
MLKLSTFYIFAIGLVALLFLLPAFVFGGGSLAMASSSPSYQIVGQLKLPTGYTISSGISMPTYITSTNTIYVFAYKSSNAFLLALSGRTGALQGLPIKFNGPVGSHFAYDARDGRLFISESLLSGYRIVAVSTASNKVVANFTAPDGAVALAYDSFNNRVYSTGCAGGCTSIAGYVDAFNAASSTLIARIPTRPSGFSSTQTYSIIYDGNNHAIYVEYSGYNKTGSPVDQVGVIKGNSLQVTTRMPAPEMNYEGLYGGNLIFDPTLNVLFDSLPQYGYSEPIAGFDAFNTTTNTPIASLKSGPDGYSVNAYDAGRQTAHGNYVIVTNGLGAESTIPLSYAQAVNSALRSVKIPALRPSWTEVCFQVLSSSALSANFADCQSYNYNTGWAGAPHVDVLSTVTGSLLARITDPSAIVSGHRIYYHLLAFGDNTAKAIEYAIGDGSGTIYEISA